MESVALVLAMGQVKSLTLSDGQKVPKCDRCGSDMIQYGPTYIQGFDFIDTHYRCVNDECVALDRDAMKERVAEIERDNAAKLIQESAEEIKVNSDTVLSEMGVPRKYHFVSFENFSGGDKYTESLLRYAENFNNSIYLYGGCGSGKTHLAVSLLREWYKKRTSPNSKAIFKPVPELLLDIRASFDSVNTGLTEKDIIEKYCGADFLVLDDFCAEKTTAFSLATLYIIINNRLNNMLPTAITSNITIGEVEKVYDERIGSRLSEYKYYNIKLPDYRKIKSKASRTTGGEE